MRLLTVRVSIRSRSTLIRRNTMKLLPKWKTVESKRERVYYLGVNAVRVHCTMVFKFRMMQMNLVERRKNQVMHLLNDLPTNYSFPCITQNARRCQVGLLSPAGRQGLDKEILFEPIKILMLLHIDYWKSCVDLMVLKGCTINSFDEINWAFQVASLAVQAAGNDSESIRQHRRRLQTVQARLHNSSESISRSLEKNVPGAQCPVSTDRLSTLPPTVPHSAAKLRANSNQTTNNEFEAVCWRSLVIVEVITLLVEV